MLLAFLIIAQLLYLASLLLWFAIFGLSFMAFDAGVSALGVAFVLSIGVYPLIVFGASIWAWLAYRKQQTRRAGWLMLAPLGYAALFFLVLQLGALLQG